MYAPIAAAAAVAAHSHRQSYPTLSRPSRFDEVARRSSNYPVQESTFYQHHVPPPPGPGPTAASNPASAYHQHQAAAQQMRQQVVPGQVQVQVQQGGHYWAPPLAPRLTAAAPRAAWPQDMHGYGAARVDPWGRYPAHSGAVHTAQWSGVAASGQHGSTAFPPYAQPHQQLEHQLLLHHYLSKLQGHYDHQSRHHAQNYQQQQQQHEQQQRYHQQQQQQQAQRQQQFYNGQHLQSYSQQQQQQQQQPSQAHPSASRQWNSFGPAQPTRQSSLVAPEQVVAPTHDWSSHVARQNHRPGYSSNWANGAAPEWKGQEWGVSSEHRGHAASLSHERTRQSSLGPGPHGWAHQQQETRHGSLSWARKEPALDAGYAYSATQHEQSRHLAPPASLHASQYHHQHQHVIQQPVQQQQYQQPVQPQRDDFASNGWRHGVDARGTLPTLAVVSPAPPPSPTGLAPAVDERAGDGAAGAAASTSGPAPPSPATIDKSSVPLYEIGVELVSAVCKSVLGSVVRSGAAIPRSSSSSSRPDSAVAMVESGILPASRREETSRSRQRSDSRFARGLGVYDASGGSGSGSGANRTDVLASQFAASGFDGSGELLIQSNSSMGGASRLAHMMTNSTEAISSGDSSEGSSEPGTPASSISDADDEFYPKPMSMTASESAPPQLRSALNFSLDQSGIWEPKSQNVSGNGATGGWATSSPSYLARPYKARKSESHSERPIDFYHALTPNKSLSYSSTRTTMAGQQDGAMATGDDRADTSSGSSLVTDGPLSLMSPTWPWTTVADDFYSLPICHGRSQPYKAFAMMEDAYVFRSHLEASGASSPTMNTDIKAAFAHFAHQVLSQTLLSPTAFMLGLLYILRVPSLVLDADGAVKDEARALFAEPPSAAPFKLFTLGMMIANKQLDDNTFTNRTWKEVTGIPLADLNRLERFYLERCHFEINVPPEVWYAFLGRMRDREGERRAHVARTAAAAAQPPSANPLADPTAAISGFDSIVGSECSRRVSNILKSLLNGEEESSISPLLGSVGEPALALALSMGLSPSPLRRGRGLDVNEEVVNRVDVNGDDEEEEEVLAMGETRDLEDSKLFYRHSYGEALMEPEPLPYSTSRVYSGGNEDPRFSAPAYHPEADVFDDDSGPVRQRAFRPHSAAAMTGTGAPGAFSAAHFDFARSQSDPTALCA
ncbi:hypothetical protein OC834_003843 [Tilletia horrida]|nr:hypothetical protein OC834_003843 [Tilletia horrida]